MSTSTILDEIRLALLKLTPVIRFNDMAPEESAIVIEAEAAPSNRTEIIVHPKHEEVVALAIVHGLIRAQVVR